MTSESFGKFGRGNVQDQPWTVATLFESIVMANPAVTAIVEGDLRVSYAELDRQATRIARSLLRRGITPGTLVGCCVERSSGLIAALLGILKAGGAYVPIDPAYPAERIDYLLTDTATPVMVTQRCFAATALSSYGGTVICLDDEELTAPDQGEGLNGEPSAPIQPESLAYVMYTSGSTGRPKGVMVEHKSIIRLVRDTNYCQFRTDDVFLQRAPISFDAATLEIWGPLLNGATLAILPPNATSLEQLGRAIRDYGVTTLWLTAGLFHLMVEQRLEDLRPVRQLLAGGDVLSPKCVQTVLDRLPGCTLINGYGPTENTTFTCCHVMHSGERLDKTVPIGRPISGTTVYILNENLQPVPIGESGELFTGGLGVARGYWNSPELTAEKFLRDPFLNDGSKMYRTGDLARWNGDENIEFLGRVDNQVKIRGHRIEPGEIETILETHRDIAQVCVAAETSGEDGSKRLIAFFTTSPEAVAPTGADELRAFLKTKLPQYMIPALFLSVPAMPLSPNGKVDRAALLALPRNGGGGGVYSESPASDAEQTIQDIWQRLLRTNQIGLDDNFFDLGGDSLLLVAAHANLERVFGIEIPVTVLFEHTTVRSLARRLGQKEDVSPRFANAQIQAQKQREIFARARMRKPGGAT